MNIAAPALAALLVCGSAQSDAGSSGFALENGFISVSGEGGLITSLRVDPIGRGNYGRNHIVGIVFGEPIPTPHVKTEIDPSGTRAALRGARFRRQVKLEQLEANAPERLTEGRTLGQVFVFEGGLLQSVQAKLPTWHTADSSCTITLYRLDGGRREQIASARLEGIEDNGWAELRVRDAKPGRFLVELSDVEGMVGWWSAGHDRIPGEATVDGEPHPGMDRAIRCLGSDDVTGDFKIDLDSNKLRVEFAPEPGAAAPRDTRLIIPWARSGYDTTSDRIVITGFLTNRGIYMPVHQFKRRPWSGVSGEWVLMKGRFGADLKFTNANIHLAMDEDRMTLAFPGGVLEIEVLPQTAELGEQFPVFFSSDPSIDRTLNAFLLSHNFNFGVGTNPDWKDWHTLQLSWTANHQADLQRLQFLSFRMADDGYVYCWGSDPGWPFPYKDEDLDGVNDFDTRHFTTNPCFILGAWREYCWSRDPAYLAKLMPRVRRAMEFILNECDGDKGVLTIKARGHEGRDGCIGSNYWDILPFGYKDAYANTHYYPCLEAMAQLEEAVLLSPDNGSESSYSGRPPRTPYYYRRLAARVRRDYNDTFWLDDKGRYAGCVDADGVTHDYGFTFINLPAMANGLADADQARRIYRWMETEPTSSGTADTYTKWRFAPRASTIHNPMRSAPQTPVPSWWSMSWAGTPYGDQCQDGGAILYTSFYDIVARARFLGADNAWQRFKDILARYARPDRLSGGSPLYFGEITQGGPGGTAGSIGVEGEFPESGLVPVSFFYAFLGIDADIHGLRIRPNLPSGLEFAGVRNVRFAGRLYDIRVTNSSVELTCKTPGAERAVRRQLKPQEVFRLPE